MKHGVALRRPRFFIRKMVRAWGDNRPAVCYYDGVRGLAKGLILENGCPRQVNMYSRRVLFLSKQILFAQAVRSLIEATGDLQVIGIEPCTEMTVARVQELHPDIIIVDDDDDTARTLHTLLDSASEVRIVRLALNESVMQVYEGHRVMAQTANDLIKVLSAWQVAETDRVTAAVASVNGNAPERCA